MKYLLFILIKGSLRGMRCLLILLLVVGCAKDCIDGIEVELWGSCYNENDLQILQDIIDINESLSEQEPYDIDFQIWENGRLTYLSLGPNQLTSIPESIGNLSSLKYFSLGSHQLTSIPESISNLSNLEYLDLQYNHLTSLPENICNIPDDCWINVRSNNLCEEYHYDCIDEWIWDDGTNGQDQSNCCEGINDESELEENWEECD